MTDVPVLRCERTGNECGTDTTREGYQCPCKNCTTTADARLIAPLVNLWIAKAFPAK